MTLRVVAYTTNSWVSPLAQLRLVGPIEQAGMELIHGNEGKHIWPERVEQADIVIIQRDFPRLPLCRQVLEQTHTHNKPLVFELDDWLFDLPLEHPDRISGHYASALLPMLQLAAEADLVIVSNAYLREQLEPINSEIVVLPNYLNDTIWSFNPPHEKTDASPLVIGFMGGGSHRSDLAMIAPVLRRVSNQFGDRVAFHFLGVSPPDALTQLPQVKSQPIETLDYAVFAAKFLQQRYDIALAPLLDSPFNRGKSAVKYLEYTTQGSVGIYSMVGPYEDVICDGETGLLANDQANWETQLCRLIEDAELRRQISEQAQVDVRQNWLLSEHAYRWREIFETLSPLRKQKKFFPMFLNSVFDQVVDAQRLQDTRIDELQTGLTEIQQSLLYAETRLAEIEKSNAWKIVRNLWRLKTALFRNRRSLTLHKPDLILSDISSYWGRNTIQPDVVIFPVMDWASRKQRPQHLAQQIADHGQRVFFLSTTFRDDEFVFAREVGSNIVEVQMPSNEPVNLYNDEMSETLMQTCLSAFGRLMKTFTITEAICKVDLPFWTTLALELRKRFNWQVIYDCMDDHRGFSSNSETMLQTEDKLIRQSDLVLVTSRELETRVQGLNPNCFLIPNAVEFDHFAHPHADTPAEIVTLPHPMVGYFGAISDWFDTDLIRDLALARPEWSFVLIGDVLYANLSPLDGLSNVYLLGEKPYRDLPAYLNGFDVTIIPFKKNPLTEATNPVKLFEYLSAGKPVVATNLGELRYYQEYIQLAGTPDEWLDALDQAIRSNSLEQIRARQDFARQNTWRQRYVQMEVAIASIPSFKK